MPVLQPKGPVAETQFHLIIFSFIMMTIIILVVFILFGIVIFKFRANRKNDDDYDPDMEGSRKLEFFWTLIPIVIVIILAIPTVITTYDLEKNPSPDKKPITIEVTAAQWKWMFRYPDQGISTVNVVHIPANHPVRFILNSETTMDSFWVPALGGQKYAMTGMTTQLFLQADEPGNFQGRNASFDGEHFAHMTFTVVAQKKGDFDNWVKETKANAPAMTTADFNKLLKPGLSKVKVFSSYPKAWDEKTKDLMMMNMPDMKGGEASEHGGH